MRMFEPRSVDFNIYGRKLIFDRMSGKIDGAAVLQSHLHFAARKGNSVIESLAYWGGYRQK